MHPLKSVCHARLEMEQNQHTDSRKGCERPVREIGRHVAGRPAAPLAVAGRSVSASQPGGSAGARGMASSSAAAPPTAAPEARPGPPASGRRPAAPEAELRAENGRSFPHRLRALAEPGREAVPAAPAAAAIGDLPAWPALSGRLRTMERSIWSHSFGVQPPASAAAPACSCSASRCPKILRNCGPLHIPAAAWVGAQPSLPRISPRADPRNSSVIGNNEPPDCLHKAANTSSAAAGGSCLGLRNPSPTMASNVSPGAMPEARASESSSKPLATSVCSSSRVSYNKCFST
mmetsp:Transcript_117117/g.372983  ORF Transcript_117117/g.372983 Transcript_117117/m.372983 type:complete len:290 (+) Transcript_117117:206-1075(+)